MSLKKIISCNSKKQTTLEQRLKRRHLVKYDAKMTSLSSRMFLRSQRLVLSGRRDSWLMKLWCVFHTNIAQVAEYPGWWVVCELQNNSWTAGDLLKDIFQLSPCSLTWVSRRAKRASVVRNILIRAKVSLEPRTFIIKVNAIVHDATRSSV